MDNHEAKKLDSVSRSKNRQAEVINTINHRMEQRGYYTSEEIAIVKAIRYIELNKGSVEDINTS